MRISDWSSDVCSSDLDRRGYARAGERVQPDDTAIFIAVGGKLARGIAGDDRALCRGGRGAPANAGEFARAGPGPADRAVGGIECGERILLRHTSEERLEGTDCDSTWGAGGGR